MRRHPRSRGSRPRPGPSRSGTFARLPIGGATGNRQLRRPFEWSRSLPSPPSPSPRRREGGPVKIVPEVGADRAVASWHVLRVARGRFDLAGLVGWWQAERLDLLAGGDERPVEEAIG